MKLLSWNVNGIRAVLGKGFADFVAAEAPDILCLQETKARPEQVELPLELGGYKAYWSSAVKPGYSGVAVFSREAPLRVAVGLGIPEHDQEGRVLTLESATSPWSTSTRPMPRTVCAACPTGWNGTRSSASTA
jgi:exodeoxyribonuclease III